MTNQQKEKPIPALRQAIKERMKSLSVSQGMLANALGMSQGNLSRYLGDNGNINSKKVDAILAMLGFSTSYEGSFEWRANFENCLHCQIRDIATEKKELKAQKKLEEQQKAHLPVQTEIIIPGYSEPFVNAEGSLFE